MPDNKWRLSPEAKKFTLKEAEEKMEGILSDGEWHLEDELFSSVIGSGYDPHAMCKPQGRVREALHNLRTRRTLEVQDLYKGYYHGVEGSWATIWRMVP